MDEKEAGFDGVIEPTGDEASTCTQNIYKEIDPTKVISLGLTDAASSKWYSGKSAYDFKTGKAKTTTKTGLTQDKKDAANKELKG
jgi:hypothetical protein